MTEPIEDYCLRASIVHPWARQAGERIKTLQREQAELEAAIKRHHAQKADDLCWMDDNELYAVVGLPPRDNSIGDPCAMLENCRRFIAKRCEAGGPWKSYAELERELAALLAKIECQT